MVEEHLKFSLVTRWPSERTQRETPNVLVKVLSMAMVKGGFKINDEESINPVDTSKLILGRGAEARAWEATKRRSNIPGRGSAEKMKYALKSKESQKT